MFCCSIITCSILTSACSTSAVQPSATISSTEPVHSDSAGTSPAATTIESDGTTYTLPLTIPSTRTYHYVAATAKGIVWIPAPPMTLVKGTEAAPVYMPDQPFTFYLSNTNDPHVSRENSQKILTLPLNDGQAKVIVTRLMGLQDHVIYHTASSFDDGAQPIREEAWVMEVDDPHSNTRIMDFHSTGGRLYSYGVDDHHQMYAGVSELPGKADGSYTTQVTVYDEQSNKVQTINDYKLSGNLLTIHYQGREVVFKLASA